MVVSSLLGKDIREHRLAAVFLTAGTLAMTLLMLAWNRQAPYSMSPFEIVRIALLSFLPLIALITGNRLIVREYLSGTRQFVEALPMGRNLPLLLKYLTGLAYLSVLAVLMVVLAAQQAGVTDDLTTDYLVLILIKTLVMTTLYWSVVFCFSLCGHLRIALYLVSAALVALVAWYPGIDPDRFAPFALMDDQLFVFERDLIPWQAMRGTLLYAGVFTLAGFALSRIGEGSLVERLAKPMTRRDYVALGVLAASGLTVWSTLLEQQTRPPVAFSSDYVVRVQDPAVSVLYLEDQYQPAAQAMAERISDSMTKLQASLGLMALPDVKLVLDPEREPHEIDYATADGVFITANWLPHDSYDDAILDTVILHGVMSAQTSGRAMFEPYHWVLDGFTRWWVEQGVSELRAEHRSELLARALWVLDIEPQAHRLIERWQLTADRFAYPGAESLAWSAMDFLEETRGRETVLALASEFLVAPVTDNLFGTLQDRRIDAQQRVESALDMSLASFYQQWMDWIHEQAEDPAVQSMLASIPALQGRLLSRTTQEGVQELEAWYEPRETSLGLLQDIDSAEGECILKHDYVGPFDTEIEVSDDYEDVAPCRTGEAVHVLNSLYSPGDRVYIALDYDGPVFHQPLRLHAERMSIP
ncbi:ABC transporter permease [Granulosicoccus sp. 3-233]|uniref:ABC transporter permease n=1 Tax=Granulosicoccus sp. 3-233 TaxID=3417969 RepID=UPI003D357458